MNDQSNDYTILDEEVFSENGHPSYSNEGLIITDTYPNRYRVQSLIQYNDINKEYEVLAKLKAPFSFTGGVKCDLHPRWDRSGRNICFDSAHTGKRALCTLNLDSSLS